MKLILKEKNGRAYFIEQKFSKSFITVLMIVIIATGIRLFYLTNNSYANNTNVSIVSYVKDIKPKVQVDTTNLLVEWVMKHKVPKPLAEDIVNHAVYQGAKQGVDPKLILSLIKVESTFKPHAISGSNALGLMQVILVWHKEKLHDYKVFDTAVNIELGTRVLAEYSKGNSVTTALLKYNGALGAPNDYPSKILNTKRDLEKFIEQRMI